MNSNRQFKTCFCALTQLKRAFPKTPPSISNRQLCAELEMAFIPQKTKADREF
jgi:hypothetical protein